MKQLIFSTLLLTIITFCMSCSDSNNSQSVPPTSEFVQILKDNSEPLSSEPLRWSDNDIQFLDEIAVNDIVGLGEATHGTKEFFQAKHRIFKYLVENHDFKVLSIEADFGESIYLNKLILEGNTTAIENEMKNKMHFWTWQTEEVRDLLLWMAEYNKGKPSGERIHYIGNDCQFNTYNPVLARVYLQNTLPSKFDNITDVLNDAYVASKENYKNYSSNQLEDIVNSLTNLIDSVSFHRDELIANSSSSDYALHLQALEVSKQVVMKNWRTSPSSNRDYFMAINTAWVRDYLPNSKVALWAHNGHIANNPSYILGSQGYFLKSRPTLKYETIGFSFSKGSFNAIKIENGAFQQMQIHTITEEPPAFSLNEAYGQTRNDAFFVDIDKLAQNGSWKSTFQYGVPHLEIGSGFTGVAKNYYRSVELAYYDYMIYIHNTNHSVFLR